MVADARSRVPGSLDPRIRGVVPVLETPFTSTGAVDDDGFLRVVDHVLGAGVSAVMFPGFASEFHKLSDDERWRLIDALLARAGDSPDVAVVISIPDHATRLALRAVERAIGAGADAINVLPPHFLGPPASEVLAHLHAVLEAADPLPVIVQHAPSLTGLSLSTESLLALARKMPNLCAVKVESVPPGPMVTALTEAAPPLATLVGYAGLHMLDAARRGAVGVQPGCSFLELYLRIWDAEAAGLTGEADALHGRLVPYLASWMQSPELIVQVEKTISLRRGLIRSDHCRRPGRPLDRVELESVDRFLEEFAPLLPSGLSGPPLDHPAPGLDAVDTAVFHPTPRCGILDPGCSQESVPRNRSRCAGAPALREGGRMTRSITADVLLDCRHDLGESALWDADRQVFRWVNIPAGELHSLELTSGEHRHEHMGGLLVNVVAADDGSLVLANDREVYRYDPDSKACSTLWTIDEGGGRTRLNDGAVDPSGRLLIGTLAYDHVSPVGGLYSLDGPARSGGSTPRRLLSGLTISNGLGWSPDGSILYHVDSPTRTVMSYDYDAASGAIRPRGVLATVDVEDAVPDGLTVDAEGCVWVALWGGYSVQRYTPDGHLDTIVEISAAHVTSCTFGGPDRAVLLITTARDGGGPEAPVDRYGGAVFAVTPGVQGQQERRLRLPARNSERES